MIPKKIHYCWFGKGQHSKLIKRCMKSWSEKLHGYEIKLWNEDNFDFDKYPFAKEAYDNKKYAFVADVVRLVALESEGGIYLDTDIEVLKSFDDLLGLEAFIGYEQADVIQTGVIGATPHHPVIQDMLGYYTAKTGFSSEDDGTVANSTLFADYFRKTGLALDNQTSHHRNISIFASEYFCPINQATQEIRTTANTYCIHYLAGSWLPRRDRITRALKSTTGKLIGFNNVAKLRNLIIRR